MSTSDSAVAGRRYSTGAMIFHWMIAIAVIVNWRLAEAAQGVSKAEAGAIMANHKALGISILLLTLGRVAWRMTHKVPPLSSKLARWETMLARTVHITFYVLLIGLPVGGWLASSFYGRGVEMWGVFTWPALPVGENSDIGKAIFELHGTGGEILIYLVALHIIGALKHTFFDKDGTLWRMLPFGTPKG